MRRGLTDEEIIIQIYNVRGYKTLGCKIPISKALLEEHNITYENSCNVELIKRHL